MDYYVSVESYLTGLLIYDNSCVIQNVGDVIVTSSWSSITEINRLWCNNMMELCTFSHKLNIWHIHTKCYIKCFKECRHS
jgi:hypothetical protein